MLCRLLSSPEFEGSEPRAVLPVPHSKEPEYLLCFTRYIYYLGSFYAPTVLLGAKEQEMKEGQRLVLSLNRN
jgi:hypothetical protein